MQRLASVCIYIGKYMGIGHKKRKESMRTWQGGAEEEKERTRTYTI